MMFGIVLAVLKESAVAALPMAATMTALRTKPRARDATVPAAITDDARTRAPDRSCDGTAAAALVGSGAASAG